MRVNQDGSGLASATEKTFSTDQGSDRFPVFLPDGDHFLYLQASFASAATKTDGIYIASLSKSEKKLIVSAHSNPGFANGYLFYADDNRALRRIAMDPKTGETRGEPDAVAAAVGYFASTQWAAFSVAENGTVVFNPTTTAAQSRLTWFDRSGKDLGTVGDAAVMANPMLSPDQTRVAVDIADIRSNSVNEWILGLKDSAASRFTFDSVEDDAGIWSRDGATITYRVLSTSTQLYSKQTRGLQSPKMFLDTAAGALHNDDIIPNSWTLDGTQILCTLQPVTGGESLMLVNASDGKLTPFLSMKSDESNGQISPDGKWAAYASNESGDWEIYVTTFPSGAGKWQVSRGGGTEPRWRGDSKEIFYIGANSTFMAVPVALGDTFSSENPAPLFRSQIRAPVSSTDLFSYDVTKDGQRFLVNRYARPTGVPPVHIILDATSPAQK